MSIPSSQRKHSVTMTTNQAQLVLDPETIQAVRDLSRNQQDILRPISKFQLLGLGPAMPQIVVVGRQSSGKSSVLEAISGLPYPVKSNGCTMFAVEVTLRMASEHKFEATVWRGNEQQHIPLDRAPSAKETLPGIIEKAQGMIKMEDDPDGSSAPVLRIQIFGPDLPNLTIVDLPGLPTTSTSAGSTSTKSRVMGLARRYLEQKNTLILVVLSAADSLGSQSAFSVAKDFDKSGERTIGVITKPDALVRQSQDFVQYVCLARNDMGAYKLPFGWYMLLNRNITEKDDSNCGRSKTSNDDGKQAEMQFFGSEEWKHIPPEKIGRGALRAGISEALERCLESQFAGTIHVAEGKFQSNQQTLQNLGKGCTSEVEAEQRKFLREIADQFRSLASAATNGLYNDKFFSVAGDIANTRKLRGNLCRLESEFQAAMEAEAQGLVQSVCNSQPQQPSQSLLTNASVPVTELQTCMGTQLLGASGDKFHEELFKEQARKWHGHATTFVQHAVECGKQFTRQALNSIIGNNTSVIMAIENECNATFWKNKELELSADLTELAQPYLQGNIARLTAKFCRIGTPQHGVQVKLPLHQPPQHTSWNNDHIPQVTGHISMQSHNSLQQVIDMTTYYQVWERLV